MHQLNTCFIALLIFLCACANKHTDEVALNTNQPIVIKSQQPQYRDDEIIETINFTHNNSKINPRYLPRLKQLAAICASDSMSCLRVFGFTDTLGTEVHNNKLSEQRTEAVYQLLNPTQILDSTSVYIEWLGESADVYDLHFQQAHPQQNCVDIWIRTRKKL